jgi:hypothetical protein
VLRPRVLNRGLVVIQLVLPLFLLFVASFAFASLISPFRFGGQAVVVMVVVSYQTFLATGLMAQTIMTDR